MIVYTNVSFDTWEGNSLWTKIHKMTLGDHVEFTCCINLSISTYWSITNSSSIFQRVLYVWHRITLPTARSNDPTTANRYISSDSHRLRCGCGPSQGRSSGNGKPSRSSQRDSRMSSLVIWYFHVVLKSSLSSSSWTDIMAMDTIWVEMVWYLQGSSTNNIWHVTYWNLTAPWSS